MSITCEVPTIIFECYDCGFVFDAPMAEVIFVGEVRCPRCDGDDTEVIL